MLVVPLAFLVRLQRPGQIVEAAVRHEAGDSGEWYDVG